MTFTATASGNAQASAGAIFLYYIEFTSPNLTGGIPNVTVDTRGSAVNGQAYTYIIPAPTTAVPNPQAIYLATVDGSGISVYDGGYLELHTPGTSFDRSDTVAAFTEGVVYAVYMDATTSTSAGTTTASIDPIFKYPSNYSLIISAGVGNGNAPLPSTPLPAALPLFATGLGALGLLGWRRKRKA
jgi:hypothetical protein